MRWTVIHAYGNMREITGYLLADRVYCVTVRTKQSADELRALAMRGAWARGKWAKRTTKGDSGEEFRPMIGKLLA